MRFSFFFPSPTWGSTHASWYFAWGLFSIDSILWITARFREMASNLYPLQRAFVHMCACIFISHVHECANAYKYSIIQLLNVFLWRVHLNLVWVFINFILILSTFLICPPFGSWQKLLYTITPEHESNTFQSF